jgi:hypothetical protein
MASADDEPKMKGPVKDFPAPKPGKLPKGPAKGPAEDFRVGEFRCLRCGAAFASRGSLDRHTEQGHSVET